ncbi:MAG: hypothetical protein KF778_03775 [Rhodocyclaceae bacterium]|nr:hypothetical protein [Rhodocyclaceae bacterium]MBX3667498.1 hypothetical protein [Rhodocyclaceae bacterium]
MKKAADSTGAGFPLTLTRTQARFALLASRTLERAIGDIPASNEAAAADPRAQSLDIATRAARRAAAISAGLALPGGLIGVAAILPSLVKVWRIQAQMVADIAAAHGVHVQLRREHLLYCLFKHSMGHAVADLAVRAGNRVLTDALSRKLSEEALRALGVGLSQQALGMAARNLLPVAGAAAIALYARKDTLRVAAAALDVMREFGAPAAQSTAERAH